VGNPKKNKKRQERLRQKKHHEKYVMYKRTRYPPYEKLKTREISKEEFKEHGGVVAKVAGKGNS